MSIIAISVFLTIQFLLISVIIYWATHKFGLIIDFSNKLEGYLKSQFTVEFSKDRLDEFYRDNMLKVILIGLCIGATMSALFFIN